MGAKYRLLKWMYLKNRLTKYIANKYINRIEGGQYYSTTLRRIFKETYDIDAGIGTYGCFSSNIRPHVCIGNYCSIAGGVQRLVGNHPIEMFSTHPFFHKKEFGYRKETVYEEKHLIIGNDVWIGANAIITAGCNKIGNGAIIGAGAIVTHDVEPYSIVVGNPARLLRYRFEPKQIELLEESKWWELKPKEVSNFLDYADEIEVFCEKVKRYKEDQGLLLPQRGGTT